MKRSSKLSATSSASTTFEVVIIGGGGAGMAAVEGAKAAGASRICLIESGNLGGECPNRACVPTKSLLASAKMYKSFLKDGLEFGVLGSPRFDLKRAMARKESVIQAIVGGGRLENYLKSQGVDVIRGKAVFEDAHTLRAGSRVLKAKSIVIATGTTDLVPPIAGLEDVEVLGYADAVSLPRLPKSIAIIGGGPVGCEFATFFASVGVKTTLIEPADHLLIHEDEELSLLAETALKDLDVTVLAKTKPLGLLNEKWGTKVTYQVGKRPRQYIWVEAVLVAAGKMPNIANLALERAKVKVEKTGRVLVNSKMQTNAKHILLAGDVSGRLMFTHTAHYEGFIAGWNAIKPKEAYDTDLSVIPRVTFIDPELASVGLTQAEAVKSGFETVIYRTAIHTLARAAVDGKQTGVLKVVVDKKTDLILGGHMLSERAGEVIHELALAMRHGLPFSAVRAGLRAYPTYSEAISALEV
ncbi:MAG: NAD(P)/FAD-dependent oxidoreductase [Patescibacteria group bacterium]|jgi:pyruvate/2-oxoglutarate dehydrogenase complex dihydrolipoamide dehydrogenase (E3) component